MRKIVYLHVGLHKTGTTSLQKFLSDNQRLLSKRGVFRLSTGLPPNSDRSWGHHDLAWSLREGDPHGLWRAARREADAHKTVLVTSEEFSFIRNAGRYSPVLDAFQGWQIRVICYLRRQDQFLESLYNYHVKALGETAPIMSFANKIYARLDYKKYLDCLSQTFGPEALSVRVYEQTGLRGDIFDDFLSAIGLTDKENFVKPRQTINAGLSPEGIKLMLEANRRLQEQPDALRRERNRILAGHQSATFARHQVLTCDEQQEFLDRFEQMNAVIAQEYLRRPGPLFPAVCHQIIRD